MGILKPMNAIFLTNQYKVLELMYSNTVNIAGEEYCPLGQGDVAKELQISRAVINRIFTELKDTGYISMITRGKWKLSANAIELIQITQKL